MDEADQGHHSDRAGGHRVSVDERLWARAPDRAGRSDLVAWPMINKEGVIPVGINKSNRSKKESRREIRPPGPMLGTRAVKRGEDEAILSMWRQDDLPSLMPKHWPKVMGKR